MKLNTTKLQEMNKEEIEKVNGGVSPFDMYTIGSELWKLAMNMEKDQVHQWKCNTNMACQAVNGNNN